MATIPHSAKEAFTATKAQRDTLIAFAAYTVGIAVLWHIPYLHRVLYPFKILVVAFHEFSHAAAGLLTCARIESIELTRKEGGECRMRGGLWFCILPAGYLGSSLLGAAMVFGGFNILASKVLAVIIMVALVGVFFLSKGWLARLIPVLFAAILVVLWVFVPEGLRYFVLFTGVFTGMYSLWDTFDDTVRRVVDTSDASVFAKHTLLPSRFWGVLWLFLSFVFFVAGLLLGIIFFKDPKAT